MTDGATHGAVDGEGHWSDPQPEEVAPGVLRIPLPLPQDGLRAVNVYALRGPDGGVTLVDGGWAVAEARDALDAALHGAGCALADVTDVLVTHAHRDHYTLAVTIRRELGARVSLGAAEQVNLDAINAPTQVPRERRSLVVLLRSGGAADLAELVLRRDDDVDLADWEAPDGWLDDETVVGTAGRVLHVVHTPGHTRGHVVYHDPAAGLLFSGDHVLTRITPSIGFEPVPSTSPLADFMASLHLVRSLPDARVLPGHGPVGPSAHARAAELLAHHEQRLDDATAAVAAGASTAHEVAQRLTWTRRHLPFATLDTFNRMLATTETLAHLVVLAQRGRVATTAVDGVLHHEVVAIAPW